MLLFALIIGAVPASILVFLIGWKAGVLNYRISFEPNRPAAGHSPERITR